MNTKKQARLKRARRVRAKIRELAVHRLCVHRSGQHIYAQVFAPSGDVVVAAASTLEESLRSGKTSNKEAASSVGKLIAERAKAAGVSQVAFDRSGFKYHGRIQALADAAREGGLEF